MATTGMGADSSIGSGRPQFPSTCWSRILGASWDAGSPAFEELARHYWKPIYAYIRGAWVKTHDDAKDLTQDFFLFLMESEFLSKADPARGRFRAYVQVALKHYLTKEERDRRRLKRGGDRKILTLGEIAEWGVPDSGGAPPEELLDRTWRRELLLRAAAQLEAELRAEGRETAFQVFRDYHFRGGPEEGSYRDVAARYGISEVDVSNHLSRTKKRFQAILASLVSETVAGPDDLAEEMRALFGGGA